MKKMNGYTMDIVAENREKLKGLFPDVFVDGKVDFEILQDILGEYVERREERYNFSWNGKSKARRLAQTPSTGTLRPNISQSEDWNNTKNLYIEGDNLEVLKLLQRSYYNKIKMIYIDPPYNTGKDFVYKDNFKDSIQNYKKITGQVDGEGRNLSGNPETSGRYHTDWLNMIYPRLMLSRNLLKDDGIIFISIDDNEHANLKKICSEIFGEENFIINLIWKKRDGAPNDRTIGSIHENILVYGKRCAENNRTIAENNLNLMPRTDKANSQYKEFSDPSGIDPRGPFRKIDTTANGKGGRYVESLYYPITNPFTKEDVVPRSGTCWRHSKEEMQKLQEDNRLYWGVDGKAKTPMRKLFLDEAKDGMTTPSILPNLPLNQHAAREIELLFNKKALFETPKPTKLIEFLIHIGTQEDDIILDFFSGSASSAEAVFNINSNEDSNRKFIQVQLPEKNNNTSEAYKAGYKTISEISIDRIRLAAKRIKSESSSESIDLGFRTFRLDTSNIKAWDADFDNIEERLLEDMIDNIKSDRSEYDILYEVIIKYGFELTSSIDEIIINGQKLYSVNSGELILFLSDSITIDVVEEILQYISNTNLKTTKLVFKDSGFSDDVVKANTIQIFKQAGIEDVRSL